MRPTPQQVFYNPEVFEELLVQAGVPFAKTKVKLVFSHMYMWRKTEMWIHSNQSAINQFYSNINRLQSDKIYRKRCIRYQSIEAETLRLKKAITNHKRKLGRYNDRLQQSLDQAQAKINSWPELEFDATQLRTKFSAYYRKIYHTGYRHGRRNFL